MSRKKYLILAKAYDRKGNLLSTAQNMYKKSHPLQKYFAEKVGLPEKQCLHAEILALVRCRDKKVYSMTVERYAANGSPALAKPCPVCAEAIRAYGVSVVHYTTSSGFVKEIL